MTLMEIRETPSEVVAVAKNQAKALMDIVESQKVYQVIGDKKYLQVEAWQTIGAFNRVRAVPEWIKPIEESEHIVGYEARVQLVHTETGHIMGAAIMECGLDEFVCRGKEGRAKHDACKSMAQTRATSKAYRLNYSWVAVLAGYEPTTAEEMTDEGQPTDEGYGICLQHDIPYFKRGRMRRPAHKLNGEWCNKPQEQEEEALSGDSGKPQALSDGVVDDVAKAFPEGDEGSALIAGTKYPMPPARVTERMFRDYRLNADWSATDVMRYLGADSPTQWLSRHKDKTYREAIIECAQQAAFEEQNR